MASEGDSHTEKKPLSRKKQRKMACLTVAELKQLVKKPEVVEWTDVTAADPRLLLHLKRHRNTIPIPIHWSAKHDYLQGKHGIEKPPFQLPAYIADTGIATMRDAVKEKEANMSLKAKTRERSSRRWGRSISTTRNSTMRSSSSKQNHLLLGLAKCKYLISHVSSAANGF
jgi:splicing factor 3B subunit 2